MARAEAAGLRAPIRGLVQDLDAGRVGGGRDVRFSFVSDRAEAILGYPVALWLADPQTLPERHIHLDRDGR